jgi:tetratricopeptide (TPR) repeat protein
VVQEINNISKFLKLANKSFDRGDFSKSVSYYSKAISICKPNSKEKTFVILLAEAYNGMGHALRFRGEFSKSKEFQEKAVKIYEKLNRSTDKLQLDFSYSLHYMGDILADLGQVQKSLSYYKQELEIVKKLYSKDNKKFIKNLVYGLNGTAIRLADTKNFNSASTLLNQSLKAQKSVFKNKKEIRNNYPNFSWTYAIIGVVKLRTGDLNGAISNFKNSLSMRKVIAKGNNKYIGALKNTLNDLGDAYSKKDNPNEAIKCYKEALKIIVGKTYRKQVVQSRIMMEEQQLKIKIHNSNSY